MSDDGSTWTQVGNDGFGISSSFVAGTNVIGDVAYLSAIDYQAGSSVWESADGQEWQIIFQNPESDPFTGGGGVMDFHGHLLWISSDLEKGLEIWRTDEVVVASGDTADESSTTTAGGAAGGVAATDVATDSGDAGGTGSKSGEVGADDQAIGADVRQESGLSAGWIALIAALAVIAAGGIGTTAYLLGRTKRTVSPSAVPSQSQSTPPYSDEGRASGPQFCAGCGARVDPDGQFCAQCGRRHEG